VSHDQGKRFAAGQVGAANAAAGSNSCCLICLPATLVRLPATYGSSQCGGQHHRPRPVAAGVPPRRLPGLEHRRARLAPGPASRGAVGSSCTWSGPTGGDLGDGSGHLARWHNSGARVRLADGGVKWPEGGATGVELERNVKRLDRYQAAVADVDPAWSSGVWWFTPRAQVGLLQQRLQDAARAPTMRSLRPPRGWPRDSPPGARAPGRPSHPLGPSPAPARPARPWRR
jgi:hypothetical protein